MSPSDDGPVRVMAAGVFDLLHTGHLHYLEQARSYGDELVVVVARDASVARRKHDPITPEEMRLELVRALKPVDQAVLGHKEDHFKTVEELEPAIIALGHDDYHDEADVAEECRRRGMEIEVVRVSKHEQDLAGTRRIVRRVLEEPAYRAYALGEEDPS